MHHSGSQFSYVNWIWNSICYSSLHRFLTDGWRQQRWGAHLNLWLLESEVRGQFTSRDLAVFKMEIRMEIYVATHSVMTKRSWIMRAESCRTWTEVTTQLEHHICGENESFIIWMNLLSNGLKSWAQLDWSLAKFNSTFQATEAKIVGLNGQPDWHTDSILKPASKTHSTEPFWHFLMLTVGSFTLKTLE